jgi:hypothetical protein
LADLEELLMTPMDWLKAPAMFSILEYSQLDR